MLRAREAAGLLLSALTLALVVYYSWLYMSFQSPGFRWDTYDWSVKEGLEHCAENENCIKAGDELLEIDGYTRQEYFKQWYKPTIRWSEEVTVKVSRQGEIFEVDVVPQARDLTETAEAVVAVCFSFLFWLCGLVAWLLLRPVDRRSLLLALACYAIAIFFASGWLAFARVAGSAIVLHFVGWLLPPLLIHLHLSLPDKLVSFPAQLTWALYGSSLLFLTLEFAGLLPTAYFSWALIIGLVLSFLITLYRQARPALPSIKVANRLLMLGSLLGLGPWFVVMALFYQFPLKDLPFGVDQLLIAGVALVAVPNWPLAYIYSIYKPGTGVVRLRGNSILGVYGFISLSIVLYVTTFFFVGMNWLSLRQHPIAVSLMVSIFFVALTPLLRMLFQGFIDRVIFGIRYLPNEVVSVFAERIPTAFDRKQLRRVVVNEVLPTLSIRQSALYLLSNSGTETLYEQNVEPSLEEELEKSSETATSQDSSSSFPGLDNESGQLNLNRDSSLYAWVREAVKLSIQGQVIGIWLFGARDPDDFYPKSDITLLTNIANQIATVVRAQQEIAENRRLQQQLVQAQKMEAIGRLSAGIAHDFNNLLTAILSYSDLLLFRSSEDDVAQKYISGIKDAGEKAEALTKQLLAFSRRQAAEIKVVNINHVVSDVEKLLRRLIGEDIELIVSLSSRLNIKIDIRQMEQAILNLAVNASDAMPNGGRLTISTLDVHGADIQGLDRASFRSESYVCLMVKDTGSGIDPQIQDHIFEPFFTTKELSKGTGLGLSMVYGIVRQSDGYIFVDSAEGEGTTFSVYLPTVGAEIEHALQVAPLETRTDAESATGTILVVEDEDTVRNVACEILQSSGYKILQARDGYEALRVSGEYQESIDLLLTDVIMPQMKGPELAEKLVKRRPLLKVVYMSGYYEESMFSRKLERMGVDLIRKPFTSSSLRRKIRETLIVEGSSARTTLGEQMLR